MVYMIIPSMFRQVGSTKLQEQRLKLAQERNRTFCSTASSSAPVPVKSSPSPSPSAINSPPSPQASPAATPAITPSSISIPPSKVPSTSTNDAALNRFTVAGSAAVVVFAAALMM
ncbi:hypothetical protein MTR_6g039370 [Medicago truncatula]|uniref:Uncharacterized protein n=1 Tax=Medicago truncatula TaxID=3880 RepID=A0A072UA94_MEDTR|nr:hypothetical protein MTR_6g039370 [Medicago truncatula]